MRFNPLMFVGIVLVVGALLVSIIFMVPISVNASDDYDLNDDGVNETSASVLAVFMKDGQPVTERPFAFTYGGSPVDQVQVTVEWSASGSDVDWSTFQATGNFKLLQYWWIMKPVGGETQEVLEDFQKGIVDIDVAEIDSSFTHTFNLDVIDEAHPEEGSDYMCAVTCTLSFTASDIYGNQLDTQYFSKSLGFTLSPYEPTGSWTVDATFTNTPLNMIGFNDLGGGNNPLGNPLIIVLFLGVILIPASYCLMKR